MSPFSLPVRRPVATSMVYAALVLLGIIAWERIPVELFPAVSGDTLNIAFNRPGSEPEVVEREVLIPLEGRISELAGVAETFASITGSGGYIRVTFEKGTDLKVRELDLRRVAADLAHDQPPGTVIEVSAPMDFTQMSRFVMMVHITAPVDPDALRALVDERLEPRLTAVPGVSRLLVFGGGAEGVSVYVDPDRAAALGVSLDEITAAVSRTARRPMYVGGIEDEGGRQAVLVEGQPGGVDSLAQTLIRPGQPVALRHVARIEVGAGREETVFRVNGANAVGALVFKKEDANLVRLGRELRARLDELRGEYGELGLDFQINFDAADLVEDQIGRLEKLALSGFAIALLALFLFLRQLRAVLVVVVSVPVSLLIALAFLYVGGQSLNLITLFGLAVGLGMLVDNAIVVYEAVQRQLERGATPDAAAEEGVRRTVRAIVAATATNAVVFVPLLLIELPDSAMRAILAVLTLAYLLPLVGSLLVALGLVPLLARRLAAPAAVARLRRLRERREERGGLLPPDRGRELFTGLVKIALTRPGTWLAGVAVAVLITAIVTTTWFAVSLGGGMQGEQANEVQITVDLPEAASLERSTALVSHLEGSVLEVDGVETVSSFIQEGSASLTITLLEEDERPEDLDPARIRALVEEVSERDLPEIEVARPGEAVGGRGGGDDAARAVLGGGQTKVVLSGPDAEQLQQLGRELEGRLESIAEVRRAYIPGSSGRAELHVSPNERVLEALGITADEILPALTVLRREGVVMQTGMFLADGREVPLTVYREEGPTGRRGLEELRFSTRAGVVPLPALATAREMPPAAPIQHHNGRRELSVHYTLGETVPEAGPRREEVEARIRAAIADVRRPRGYTVEIPPADESISWFRKIVIPVVLLLLAVLAVTFESLVVPTLILVALPMTLIGATWTLVLTGTRPSFMVIVGALALLGLTVNPAILLVDRMQQRVRAGFCGPGGAALAAVRERTRPVLMTTVTTVAGLWPLALTTGQQDEIWPPFAIIVMGGLIASTVLTLLVIPVGFVLLRRLDEIFGRLGAWVVLAWLGLTAASVTPLFVYELVTSLTWQIITTLLAAGGYLGLILLIWRRRRLDSPEEGPHGAPEIDVRFLHKTYGQPGPIGEAWRADDVYARRVLARGRKPFHPAEALSRLAPLSLLLLGSLYLVRFVESGFWHLVMIFVAATLVALLITEVRRARGRTDVRGRVDPGGVEAVLAAAAPWVGFCYITIDGVAIPALEETLRRPILSTTGVILLGAAILGIQLGRRTARRMALGLIGETATRGRLRVLRSFLRRFSRRLFGLDLPREEVAAAREVEFTVRRGMVGILGPNGAGKTTLLRVLAGILDPSRGVVTVGGVRLEGLRRHLARWVGYLPQDFGLPQAMTAREYLEYFALLYEIGDARERSTRVERLLDEVGLGERADEKIGGYSGGMRQRVAIARTLLRLPKIIIVDEPTVGLDPRERIRFRNLLARLAAGRIILFSTHVVEDVAVACERVIVMSHGRIVYDGPPAKLAEQAKGRAWQLRVDARAVPDLEKALVTDQVPEEDGTVRMRILAVDRPHPEAESAEPVLEDGYLVLVSERDLGRAS